MQDDDGSGKSSLPGDGGDDENSAPAQLGDPKPGHELSDDDMGLDDGYEFVTYGRRTRKVKKRYSNPATPAKKGDEAATPAPDKKTYNGKAPPPPPELYHGKGAVTQQTVVGKSIYFYKVRLHQDLRASFAGQAPAKDFQNLYGFLKKSDPDILLVPLTSTEASEAGKKKKNEGEVGDYIDQPVLIPTADAHLLQKYFSYTVDREQLNGVFVIRSTRSLWSIKENAIVRAYTTRQKIRLSATSFTTEKRRECFLFVGAIKT